MRIVVISVVTGLLCATWLYQMMFPFTITRFAIYGFLFITTALTGLNGCDRVRHQEGMWGQQT